MNPCLFLESIAEINNESVNVSLLEDNHPGNDIRIFHQYYKSPIQYVLFLSCWNPSFSNEEVSLCANH